MSKKSEDYFLVAELARRSGKGSSTIHAYRERGILNPADRNGRCHYDSMHLAILSAVDRLKGPEFRLSMREIQSLAHTIPQSQLARLSEMKPAPVRALLRKHGIG